MSVQPEARDGLAQSIAALAAVDLQQLSGVALVDEVIRLRRLLDQLEGQWLRRVAAAQRAHGHDVVAASSMAGVLRSECRISSGRAAEIVRTACRLDHLPETARAVEAGAIGYRHAQVLARAVTPERHAAATELGVDMAVQEKSLVDAAEALDPVALRRLTEHWAHAMDPVAVGSEEEAMHQRRHLHVSRTFDGMTVLDGLLDPEGGAAVLAALDAMTWPPADGDARTPAQRRADALVDLFRGSGRGREAGSGDRAHLTVLVDLDTLHRKPGAPAATLGSQHTVGGESARRIACDASVTRVITAGRSQPLDVGRATRTISPSLRTALMVRDGGCAYPGCDRPPEHCDGHHITHWVDGGPTSLDNLVLLCRHHHRAVHDRSPWAPSMTAGGSPQWTATSSGVGSNRVYAVRPRAAPL